MKEIVGIWVTWNLNIWDRPEDFLKKRLTKNPTYPFREVSPNNFAVEIRDWRLQFGYLTAIFGLVTVCSWYFIFGYFDEYFFLVTLSSLVTCLYLIGCFRQPRKLVLNSESLEYLWYKGEELLYHGHYHNVYLRLAGQSTGSCIYYKLVIRGYKIEGQDLCRATKNKEKLVKFGKRLAAKLNLNFFDYEDSSSNHAIRHYCPPATNGKTSSTARSIQSAA
ncbi:cation channel sperm-associated auxiliary subunit TMEM249-like [Branchiostoma floridae x Branchiostoma belcheri]